MRSRLGLCYLVDSYRFVTNRPPSEHAPHASYYHYLMGGAILEETWGEDCIKLRAHLEFPENHLGFNLGFHACLILV